MTPDSANSNHLESEEPIPMERRVPVAGESVGEVESKEKVLPIEVSDQVTFYSARSEIREPIKLVRNIFSDFWAGRELSWRLLLRNIRGLYRQTLLGLFWAFLPPVANTAVWVFLKKVGVFETGETSVDPVVFILTGMILWQAFIDAFLMPSAALLKSKGMISKLNFPRESLLLVGLGEIVFDLMIRLLLLIPTFMIFQVELHPTILLAPLFIVALILLGTALGLFIMPFGSLYQDVGRFISMMTPFWMIITPVIYPPKLSFPGSLLNWVNPASPILIVARDMLLEGTTDFMTVGLIYAIAAVPLALFGLILYRISIPVLVERMTA